MPSDVFRYGFLLIAAAASVMAFVGLTTASLSIDELFTAYFSDPQLAIGNFFQRAATDVHPPAYYLALYGLLQAGGDFTVAGRGFSAACAVLALVVLYFANRDLSGLAACSCARSLRPRPAGTSMPRKCAPMRWCS